MTPTTSTSTSPLDLGQLAELLAELRKVHTRVLTAPGEADRVRAQIHAAFPPERTIGLEVADCQFVDPGTVIVVDQAALDQQLKTAIERLPSSLADAVPRPPYVDPGEVAAAVVVTRPPEQEA